MRSEKYKDSQQLHTWCVLVASAHTMMVVTMLTYIRPPDNVSVARQRLQHKGLQSTEQH